VTRPVSPAPTGASGGKAELPRQSETGPADRGAFTCACVIDTDTARSLGVDACRFICVRPEKPSLYADSQCVQCLGHGSPPSWLQRETHPATNTSLAQVRSALLRDREAEIAAANLERRSKSRGPAPEGSRPIPGFPGFAITESGEAYRGPQRLAECETSGGLRAVQLVAADGTHTRRTVARLLHDVWGAGEKPKRTPRKIKLGRCPWLDGCEEDSAPIKNGETHATPRELIPFCAHHRHVLRMSRPERDRHGIPHTLTYANRVSIGSRARSLANAGPIDANAARLLLELVDSAGGIDRIRELAGGAS
jgi:hypothetical protein